MPKHMHHNRYIEVRWIATVLAMLSLSACSDQIEVVRPGAAIPVVYAIFDPNDDQHYVKLTKSFAGEDNPYFLARDSSRIFYRNARISLQGMPYGIPLNFHRESGLPRMEGSFPPLPNEYYVLKQKIDPGFYRLLVVLPDGNDTLMAEFAFLEQFKVFNPKVGLKRFYFYEDPILFTWNQDPAAGLYEIAFILRYEEWMKNGDSALREATFNRQLNLADLEKESGRYNYRFFSESFFASLGTTLSKDGSIDFRKAVDLEMMITAADTTLSRYLNWYRMEIDGKENPNGNIKGAIGVVGTKRTVRFPNLVFSGRSQDSLVRGRFTKDLRFVNNPEW